MKTISSKSEPLPDFFAPLHGVLCYTTILAVARRASPGSVPAANASPPWEREPAMRRSLSVRAVLCLGIALAACGAAAASDWPRFHGPNGTGISTDKDVPLTWTDKENVLWKTPLPGTGNSSPIISRGRVFLQTASDNGSERQLLCLDASSGKILWTQKVSGKKARINRLNSLASSTCCADGERVYCVFWDGEETALYAYTFDGKELWKHPLGEFKSQHGPGGSPIVHDGKIVYVNDQDGSSEVLCLDARTG